MSKKQRFLRSIFLTSLMVAGASSVSLLGGIGLEAISEKLLPIIPLLVATPALNTMVGDYASVIAAHATDKNARSRNQKQLALALLPSLLVNATAVSLISLIVAIKRDFALESVFITKFVAFCFLSIFLVVASMLILTKIVDKMLDKKATNPDDVLIPIVTSVTDVLMLGLISVAALWLF